MRRFIFLVVAVSVGLMFSGVIFSETVDEIEKILTTYKEKGYKFQKKISYGVWEVSLEVSEGYSKNIYVYVSANNNNPDFDIVYVSASIKSYTDSEIVDSLKDLLFALTRNSAQGEWGVFSLYKDEDKNMWYLDYNVKLRRVYANQNHLMNAIGWVAGASSVYEKVFK